MGSHMVFKITILWESFVLDYEFAHGSNVSVITASQISQNEPTSDSQISLNEATSATQVREPRQLQLLENSHGFLVGARF